jgi:nucleotide-binding universal stress UspA family protein
MYRRILVPHDGSPFAEQVLPHVIDIALPLKAEVHLLEVIPDPNPAVYSADLEAGAGVPIAVEAIDEAQDELREQGKLRLEELARQLAGRGISAVWTVTNGDPAREIIKYEVAHEIDLVAMASHGRTGLIRALLGSVTDAVLRGGGKPVLVVRATED